MGNTRSLVLFVGLSSLLSPVLSSQFPLSPLHDPIRNETSVKPQILDSDFEDWLSDLTKEWGMKGLAIAVVRRTDGGEWNVETKGYGQKNAAGDAVTEDTMFAVASNSKLFATLALGLLVNDTNNTLRWSSKIADILGDEWQLQDPVAQRDANLLDLISHRVGLPRHDLARLRGRTAADTVRRLRYLRPSSDFRETLQYNNLIYMTIAHIVETVSGLEHSAYVQSHIIDRLPFKSATYNSTKARLSGHLADGFARVAKNVKNGMGFEKSLYKPTKFYIDEEIEQGIAGPGGVMMSASDAAVWLQTLLLNGRHPVTDEQVIVKEAIQRAASGLTVLTPEPYHPEVSVQVYGGGQTTYAYQGHNIVEHNGGWSGWLSVISRSPHNNLGIAVFTNWDEGVRVMEIIKYYLYEKALGLPHVDWSSRFRPKPTEDTDTAATAYHTHPSSFSDSPLRVPLEQLAGTYHHGGYGTYDLCISPSSSLASRCATSDSRWTEVRRANLSNLEGQGVKQQLGAAIGSAIVNFMQFTHHSGTTFNVSSFFVTTAPIPISKSIGPSSETGAPEVVVVPHFDVVGTAEFVVGDDGQCEGFALNGVWGEGNYDIYPATGETVKERAEVWFERVE